MLVNCYQYAFRTPEKTAIVYGMSSGYMQNAIRFQGQVWKVHGNGLYEVLYLWHIGNIILEFNQELKYL